MKKRIMDKNLFNRLIKSTEQMVMIEKKLVAKVESITKIPLENVSYADLQNPHTFSQNLKKQPLTNVNLCFTHPTNKVLC